MPAFDYQALDPRGRLKKGLLEGDSARQVRQMLRDQGLAPTSVILTRQGDTDSASGNDFLSSFFHVQQNVLF